MDYIEKLKQEAATLVIKRTCTSCRHYKASRLGADLAKCRETADFIQLSRSISFDAVNRCGSTGRLWEPRPLSFWRRLSDAIIKRVAGE